MIFGTGNPSRSLTRMLDGFRSRLMMPFWCACCTPSHTCKNSAIRWGVVRWCRLQYDVIASPGLQRVRNRREAQLNIEKIRNGKAGSPTKDRCRMRTWRFNHAIDTRA